MSVYVPGAALAAAAGLNLNYRKLTATKHDYKAACLDNVTIGE
jgi:hypothetical protein